jgi:hypothetical protein
VREKRNRGKVSVREKREKACTHAVDENKIQDIAVLR